MPATKIIGPAGFVGGLAVLAAFVKFEWLPASLLVSLTLLVLCGAAIVAVCQRILHFLGEDEQLRVNGLTGTIVKNGPGLQVLNPFTYKSCQIVKAHSLGTRDYLIVRDTMGGSERVEKGPKLFFPGAYEQVERRSEAESLSNTEYLRIEDKLSGGTRVVQGPCMWIPEPHEKHTRGTAVSLSQTEYIIVEDKLTGDKETVRGPCIWVPKPYDSASSKFAAIALQEDEYICLKDCSSGGRWVQKGKALVFPKPTWKIETTGSRSDTGVRKAWTLKAYEYIRLVNKNTGEVTSHRGEKTVFPEPDEELLDGEVLTAIDLKVHEYVKILDQSTGEVRVESGRASGSLQVFLGPHDKVLNGGKQKAIQIDDDHAVLVRDKATGQLSLVTEKQLYVPGPNETIEEVRELIKLSDHEAMIIKDKDGQYKYFYGSESKRALDQPRAFFLPPFAEVVELIWSRGRKREKRDLRIQRFDCRAQFMSFEFNCRTADNVELVLEGTFFWEVVDLPTMVKTTGDTSGDLCNHARSQFIRHVAKVTLKQFMDESHVIAKKVWEDDTAFYDSRGVKIHSLEVTRYTCADPRTSQILEQIIQETTNRMNRLSQAESENEVNLFRTQGQIEQEKVNGELLKIQHEHAAAEAEVSGKAEAARIAAFLNGLDELPVEERTRLWGVLRKTDALTAVSQGGASIYYTPNDVDLSIETKAPRGE